LQDYRSFSSSSSSVIFFFRDEELGWMDDGTDGWKGRPQQDKTKDIIYKDRIWNVSGGNGLYQGLLIQSLTQYSLLYIHITTVSHILCMARV
jgi:hypothetical protein